MGVFLGGFFSLYSSDPVLRANLHTVFFFHGHLVGMHGLVVAIQCGNEHDQGALRQVEVGDQAVDAVELDARVQENGGIAAAQKATGLDWCIVNGQVAIDHDRRTTTGAGMVLTV